MQPIQFDCEQAACNPGPDFLADHHPDVMLRSQQPGTWEKADGIDLGACMQPKGPASAKEVSAYLTLDLTILLAEV
jgi:hypothetical protein